MAGFRSVEYTLQVILIKRMSKDLEILTNLFLVCPNTDEETKIVEIEEDDTDENVFSIYTRGESHTWKFKVRVEECE